LSRQADRTTVQRPDFDRARTETPGADRARAELPSVANRASDRADAAARTATRDFTRDGIGDRDLTRPDRDVDRGRTEGGLDRREGNITGRDIDRSDVTRRDFDRSDFDRGDADRRDFDRSDFTRRDFERDFDRDFNRSDFSRYDRDRIDHVRSSFRDAVRTHDNDRSMANWLDRHGDRHRDWHDRGDRIRDHYHRHGHHHHYFGGRDWWYGRNFVGFGLGFNNGLGWWGYSPWYSTRPYWYWWSRPTWGYVCDWFPGYGWADPYYYDYGAGGNVVYTTNYVVVNGQPVATPEDYAASARALADVDPALISDEDQSWMPLGTFSMAVRADEVQPERVIQLAVNKGGIISGTVLNEKSGNVYAVRGRVDPDTQRTAFFIGTDEEVVFETGLYNMTRDETELLVHFGQGQRATYFLVRLPPPDGQQTAGAPIVPDIAR